MQSPCGRSGDEPQRPLACSQPLDASVLVSTRRTSWSCSFPTFGCEIGDSTSISNRHGTPLFRHRAPLVVAIAGWVGG